MEVALNEAVMRRISFSRDLPTPENKVPLSGTPLAPVFNNNKPTCVKSPLYSQYSPQAKAEGHKVIHFSEK